MSNLGKYLAEQLIQEIENITDYVVVYAGRFQPFHEGHFKTYQHLVNKFGKNNVYIGTSDKTDKLKSPFNFKEKQTIMRTMFGIPSNKIVQIKNPYAPTEILKNFDENTTAFITVVGEKDEARLGGKYFTPYNSNLEFGYKDKGYVYTAPAQPNAISGTDVRNWLGKGDTEYRKKLFTKAYPKYNDKIFNLITSKLDTLNESVYVDAGEPETAFYVDGAKRIINGAKPENWFKQGGYIQIDKPKSDYMRGKGKSKDTESQFRKVTYKIKGVTEPIKGKASVPYQVDKWKNVTPKTLKKKTERYWDLTKVNEELALAMGYPSKAQLIQKQKERDELRKKMDKQGDYYTKVEEDITIPIKVGDTVLGGKFKNKKITVKDIGKNEKGEITINGKPLLKYRLIDEAYTEAVAELMKDPKFESLLSEIPMDDLQQIDKFADKQLNPLDVVITDKHFLDRLVDPRNKKPISTAELLGFFKRLARQKDKFVDFLKKYGEIVAKDNRTKINIPFMKQANKAIAKTIMRKDDFKTPSPELKFEDNISGGLSASMSLEDIAKKHNVNIELIKSELKKGIKVEKEHTADIKIAKEIAMDHLVEDPNYYTKLAGIESSNVKKEYTMMGSHIKKPAPRQGLGDELNELTKGQIFGGKIKIGGESVPIEVELLGADNKKKVFITKIIGVDKKWLTKLPKDGVLEIPARIFRTPGGGWYKIKTPSVFNESILSEGGAYGHMSHPFDIDINLTFGQLKDIVKKALTGELELTREKTDGQALAISWVNGRLVAARNKSHLKDRGKGAMGIEDVASKFANRGGLTDAYNFAMKDLSVAIQKLSDKQKEKIFGNGSKFMNLEVIYPTSVNVIPYGQALLVFHGTFEYDVDGNIIGEDQSAGGLLANMIKQINQDVQSKYKLQGPPVVKLPKNKDLESLQPKYLNMISKLQKEYGLKDNQGVAEYHQKWWEEFVNKNAPELDSQQKISLVKRWAFMDKSFRLKDIQDEKIRKWAEGVDKTDQQKISKENLMKFEKIFLGVGAEVLSFMSSVLTVNPDTAKRAMVDKLQKTINDVEASGDPKKIEKLRLELQRMEDIGGFEKIVPAEGIVFSYNGNTMKLTGAFASLNQINGIFFR